MSQSPKTMAGLAKGVATPVNVRRGKRRACGGGRASPRRRPSRAGPPRRRRNGGLGRGGGRARGSGKSAWTDSLGRKDARSAVLASGSMDDGTLPRPRRGICAFRHDRCSFATEHQRTLVQEVCAAVQTGRLVVVAGLVGSGKTHLLQRIEEELARAGLRCRPLSRRSSTTSPRVIAAWSRSRSRSSGGSATCAT